MDNWFVEFKYRNICWNLTNANKHFLLKVDWHALKTKMHSSTELYFVARFNTMKYYIIAGEASGDLHGSNLIKERGCSYTQLGR